MLRLLELLTSLNQGGVDKIVFDYCSRLSEDIDVDFVVCRDFSDGMLERRLKQMGHSVYYIPKIRDGFLYHCKELYKIIKAGKYDIVHDNTGYNGFMNHFVYYIAGVPIRIAHAHFAFIPETWSQRVIRYLASKLTILESTELMACGQDAAVWMWGKKRVQDKKVYIVKNAINIRDYSYSYDESRTMKEQLGIKDKIIVGNVARFTYQKNHEFLIDIFNEFHSKVEDSVLLLIGEGENQDKIKKMVSSYGLSDNVIFLGIRPDVSSLLNCMDIFLLPSRFEGLPVVLVEAQANGLPVIVSTNVTKEIKLLETTCYLPLDNPEEWARKAIELVTENKRDKIVNIEYDINTEASKFEDHLISLYKDTVCNDRK